jgi:hypothetical protein
MASITEIANLALSLIGESGISDISDTSDKASRTCATNFNQARDECLAMARWSFAKRQATVTKLTAAPSFEWAAAFELPVDFIRLCKIAGDDAWNPKEYFDVQGRTLLVNLDDEAATTLNIEYIRREEDPTLYSPLFVEALSYKLAHKIAKVLTDSDRRSQEILREFEQVVMPRCRTIDLQQRLSGRNHPVVAFLRRSRLIRARGGSFPTS